LHDSLKTVIKDEQVYAMLFHHSCRGHASIGMNGNYCLATLGGKPDRLIAVFQTQAGRWSVSPQFLFPRQPGVNLADSG
jgi:hypothetical protein